MRASSAARSDSSALTTPAVSSARPAVRFATASIRDPSSARSASARSGAESCCAGRAGLLHALQPLGEIIDEGQVDGDGVELGADRRDVVLGGLVSAGRERGVELLDPCGDRLDRAGQLWIAVRPVAEILNSGPQVVEQGLVLRRLQSSWRPPRRARAAHPAARRRCRAGARARDRRCRDPRDPRSSRAAPGPSCRPRRPSPPRAARPWSRAARAGRVAPGQPRAWRRLRRPPIGPTQALPCRRANRPACGGRRPLPAEGVRALCSTRPPQSLDGCVESRRDVVDAGS